MRVLPCRLDDRPLGGRGTHDAVFVAAAPRRNHFSEAAAGEGRLFYRRLRATYFTTPRPVYELYDLEADPSELNNLSGKPELAAVERPLREALIEKMILDFDYLPLPSPEGSASPTRAQKRKR